MAKCIGAFDQMNGQQDISVEELKGLSNKQSADKVAQQFALIANEYSPLNHEDLPCYLPAMQPPKVDEHAVYENSEIVVDPGILDPSRMKSWQ